MIGCSVHNIMIGTPGDFLKAIAQEVSPDFLVIIGHGSPAGLYCGEFIHEVDTSMLVKGYLPPDVISEHLALPGCNVIGAFCHSGADAMIRTFAGSRVRTYLGFNCAPSTELCLFVVNYLWRVTKRQMAAQVACMDAIQATDPDLARWVRFQEGTGEPTVRGDSGTRAGDGAASGSPQP
jgi:hypothetical protein